MAEVVVQGSPLPPAGVVGLEGIWTWDPDGAGLVLNDLSAWPRYKLRRISGLYAKADLEAQADPAIGRIGEVPRRGSKAGKTLTLEGDVETRSLDDLRAALGALGAAFAPDDEREMIVRQHPSYGSRAYRFWARCVTCEGTEEQLAPPTAPTFGYERPFAIGLRMSDPRFYAVETQEAETGSIAIASGIELPAQKPFEIPTAAAVGTVEIEVGGSAPTDPVIDIHGPITNPVIANLTLGVDLRFSGLVLGAGEFVRIDFRSRRVLIGGLSDGRAALDLPASSWWDAGTAGLTPGFNQLRLAGDTIADPARARVTWSDAHWA